MSSTSRMGLIDFSRQLIKTGDLDPVYICVNEAPSIKGDLLKRWLFAYMLFYDVGAASYFSEIEDPKEYWEALLVAAFNEEPTPMGTRWPRASERRHFRGAQAVASVLEMRSLFRNPEDPIDSLLKLTKTGGFAGKMDASFMREHIEDKYRGFGSWASFKICDLMERTMGAPIHFDKSTAMYDTPVAGAKMYYRDQHDLNHDELVLADSSVDRALADLEEALGHMLAPPRFERELNFQEYETCLCKWKSHWSSFGKRYWIGKDIEEIFHSAAKWRNHSRVAREFWHAAGNMKVDMELM